MKNNRIGTLRKILTTEKIDAFLVTNPFNIVYLTGFETLAPSEREAFVLITQTNVYLFSDGRYENKTQVPVHFRLLTGGKNLIKHLAEIIKEENIKNLGFEKEDLKWSEYEAIKKSEVILFPLDRIIVKLRAVKDDFEIKNIKEACKITDQSLDELIPYLKRGKSEKEIAFISEQIVRKKGYELSFDPIVACDKNSSIPHYNTKMGRGIIEENSLILIDCGVKYKGYCSDITRIFFVGKIPEIMRKTYLTLKQVQQETIGNVLEDRKFSDVDLFCRKQMTENGLLDFPHSTGHGVGLEIHEYPKVSSFSPERISKNNIFTIEPGIYLSGKWGIRIEDTVLIDNKGKCIPLTQFSKEIISL